MYETDHPAYTALQKLGREITGLGVIAGLNGKKAAGGKGTGAKGVVVFSAHWQAGKRKIEVNVGEGDGLIYEYVESYSGGLKREKVSSYLLMEVYGISSFYGFPDVCIIITPAWKMGFWSMVIVDANPKGWLL